MHCSPETSQSKETPKLPSILFDEKEIVIEPYEADDDDKANKSSKNEEECLKEYENLAKQGQTGTLADVSAEELNKYVGTDESAEDKYFKKFKKEVDKDPEQILRYKRGGNVLWIADNEVTGVKNIKIPLCEICNSPREFEFQIMPQMLLHLNDENLDWGVLAVYTCPKSCELPQDMGYVREFLIKQDIVGNENKL